MINSLTNKDSEKIIREIAQGYAIHFPTTRMGLKLPDTFICYIR